MGRGILNVSIQALGRLILQLTVISWLYFHFKTSLCLNVAVQPHSVSRDEVGDGFSGNVAWESQSPRVKFKLTTVGPSLIP